MKVLVNNEIVQSRKRHLLEEAKYVLLEIAKLSPNYAKGMTFRDLFKCLSDSKALYMAMETKILSAPGITLEQFSNPDMLTKSNKYGFIDCYENWEDKTPMSEEKRIRKLVL